MIVILFLINTTWILVITFLLLKYRKEVRLIYKIKNREDVRDLMLKLAQSEKSLKLEFNEVYEEFKRINLERVNYFSKYYLNHYTISDDPAAQSYSLALLDSKGSGIILTCIQSMGQSNVYCKKIVRGRCSLPLSKEEKKTIQLSSKK